MAIVRSEDGRPAGRSAPKAQDPEATAQDRAGRVSCLARRPQAGEETRPARLRKPPAFDQIKPQRGRAMLARAGDAAAPRSSPAQRPRRPVSLPASTPKRPNVGPPDRDGAHHHRHETRGSPPPPQRRRDSRDKHRGIGLERKRPRCARSGPADTPGNTTFQMTAEVPLLEPSRRPLWRFRPVSAGRAEPRSLAVAGLNEF